VGGGFVDEGGTVGGLGDELFGWGDGCGYGASRGRGDGLREVEDGVELIPADAAGELEEVAEVQGVEKVEADAFGFEVGNRDNIAGAAEGLLLVRVEERGVGNGVDLVKGIAVADGV